SSSEFYKFKRPCRYRQLESILVDQFTMNPDQKSSMNRCILWNVPFEGQTDIYKARKRQYKTIGRATIDRRGPKWKMFSMKKICLSPKKIQCFYVTFAVGSKISVEERCYFSYAKTLHEVVMDG